MSEVTANELAKIINEVTYIILHQHSCGMTSIKDKVYIEICNEPLRDSETKDHDWSKFTTEELEEKLCKMRKGMDVRSSEPEPDIDEMQSIELELADREEKQEIADKTQEAVKLVSEGIAEPSCFPFPSIKDTVETFNNPFPPQDRLKHFTPEDIDKQQRSGNTWGYIGTWKLKTARKIVEQLHKDGFETWLRGRGKRAVGGFKDSKRYQCYLPQKLATHGAIYINVQKLSGLITVEGDAKW